MSLIEKHNVGRAFITGHSLGGGLANVAHLVVRGQLALAQAGLLGKGSPWARPGLDNITWLSCTFAAPETIVRKYEMKRNPSDPDNPPPPLIVALDNSSYNIVYGCDPVPRDGMLSYVGNLLQIVVPEIQKYVTSCKVNKDQREFRFLLKLVALKPPTETSGGKVPSWCPKEKKKNQTLVEFLKTNGIAYVLNYLTHLGTVVYQKSECGIWDTKCTHAVEDKKYKYLAGEANIRNKLNVKDEDTFKELWGAPTHPAGWVARLVQAHNHYRNFCSGCVKKPPSAGPHL